MTIKYDFKDSKAADTVARALLFVARFSKKQALVKFSDSSVSVIWGGSPKTYYIHAEAAAMDLWRNKRDFKHFGLDHCTVIQVNPSILGKTLRGCIQDKVISVRIMRPNKIQVQVEYVDTGTRVMIHTIPCDMKTIDDYSSMLIGEIEQRLCRYNTRSYLDTIHRFRNIIESFVRLNTARVYIWCRKTEFGNNMTIQAKNSGSDITVHITELDDGFEELPNENAFGGEDTDFLEQPQRSSAGVYIDTKRLASFLSGLQAPRKSRVCFDIEHNKCLKITLDNDVMQGEKFYQSILLLHSLL